MPVTVPYASKVAHPEAAPPVRFRTTLAAAWLIAIAYAVYSSFWNFFGDQSRLTEILHRAFLQLTPPEIPIAAHSCTGPLAYGFCVGCVAAAALWHWPRAQLRLIVLIPVAAGAWQITSPALRFRAPEPSVFLQLLSTLMQCAALYFGTRVGRPIIRRFAQLVLPPNLSDALTPLWSRG
jgi:hypothetical protein